MIKELGKPFLWACWRGRSPCRCRLQNRGDYRCEIFGEIREIREIRFAQAACAFAYRGYAPTYADSISADDPAYDDPIVRQAVVDALGRYNGSVVAVDPNTGRISGGCESEDCFQRWIHSVLDDQPTIAVAALEENVITRDTMLKVGRRKYMEFDRGAGALEQYVSLKSWAAAWVLTRFRVTGVCSGWASLRATICLTSIRDRFRHSRRHLAVWGACRVSVKAFR